MADDTPDLKPRIKEILEELQNESFKNDVLEALKEASKRKPLQHPAFLLFLGFLLTGVLGTWLTSYWQSRDQQKQQQQLAHERAILQKYDIADRITKAVSETYTAVQVMSHLLDSQPITKTDKEALEREIFWNQAIRKWIPDSLLLQQKVVISFKDDSAVLYKEIVTETENMSVDINESLAKVKETRWKALGKKEKDISTKDIDARRTRILNSADSIRDKTQALLTQLIAEIHAQETEGTSKSDSWWPTWLPG